MNNKNENDGDKGKTRLRPEARPAPYKLLDKQQRDAFGRMVQLIAQAIDGIDASRGYRSADGDDPTARLPSWLDRRSATRMLFLHGHRGTGKTTVMLSLIGACFPGGDANDYPKDLLKRIEKLRNRVVWLEPIAMEPLPSSTNLLAAFLARIDGAVQERIRPTGEDDREAGGRGRGGAFGWVPDYEKALLQLQRLQTAVAVAWDGNLPARGGHLDPDNFAVEVVRAERDRLLLRHNLSATLDGLANKLYPRGAAITDPLFILPVDDVDLDPVRCLEILKLIRLVQVPRLFTFISGNLRVVDLALNLHYSNELAAAYGGKSLTMLSIEPREVRSRAGEIAANAIQKLIPLAQRINLESLSVRESLNFKPFAPDDRRLPRFHELLERCPLTIEAWPAASDTPKPQNLRDFLLYPTMEVNEEDIEKSHYSAKQILKAPPRRIADWWFELRRLLESIASIPENEKKNTDTHREIVFALGRICYWAISEDYVLPTRERSTYRQALRINQAGFWELVEVIDSIPDIDRAYTLFDLRSDSENHPWKNIQPPPRIWISRGKGWYLRPAKGLVPEPPVRLDLGKTPDYAFTSGISAPRFNDDSTYALILLHDLLALGPEWEIMRQSVQINRPLERWAATIWGGPQASVWISWPAPLFWSYWEFDLFVDHWNRVVNNCRPLISENSVENTLQPLAYGWIDAGQAVWHRQPPLGLGDTTNAMQIPPWNELAEKVAGLIKLAEKGGSQSVLLKPWLWRLAYFLSPAVSGMTPDVVKAFAKAGNGALRAEWEKSRDVITHYHQTIIDFLDEKKMNTLAIRLGHAIRDHLKAIFPEGGSPRLPAPGGGAPSSPDVGGKGGAKAVAVSIVSKPDESLASL